MILLCTHCHYAHAQVIDADYKLVVDAITNGYGTNRINNGVLDGDNGIVGCRLTHGSSSSYNNGGYTGTER